MKRTKILSIIIILIIIIGVLTAISYTSLSQNSETKPIHFGVTYGGDNLEDAKALIDKVKDYTNLFVIGSVPGNEITDIGDYAVNAGLDVILYFGSDERYKSTNRGHIDGAIERWGSHLLGVYYGDEPGGKTLDGTSYFTNLPGIGNVSKTPSGGFVVSQKNGSLSVIKTFEASGQINLSYNDLFGGNSTYYNTDGTIRHSKFKVNSTTCEELTYYPNGTVTLVTIAAESITEPVVVTDRGSVSQFEPYQKVWDTRPFQTYNETIAAMVAEKYVNGNLQYNVGWINNEFDVNVMTSDYALYWWDYQGGYDTVFAELGWNNSVAQEVALVRGAANLQDKSWGTILTWKYTHAPYLTDGNEMFEQMKASYEAGAEYVIVFNYAQDMSSPYGTLKEEHFQALERFWNDVAQNPVVTHGSVKAEAVLVLPKDYGWGMRFRADKIWGLWEPDGTSEQVWSQLQSKLGQYGQKLDIVYDDPAYPVTVKYGEVFYWNQTG
ncbi:MAG: hypothetical protein ACFCUE_08910 [Candidatus Bathyarchaeia archaeon]|jgi:hypothetical protein